MGLHKGQKIKHLLKLLPEGVVAPSGWLYANGYSRQLLYEYVQNNWLRRCGHGAYFRLDVAPDWKGVVLGLQYLAGLSFHLGGITALSLQGYSQYLPLDNKINIYLFGRQVLPAWVSSIKLPQKLIFNSKFLFAKEIDKVGLTTLPSGVRNWELIVSTPERAIFEVLGSTGSSVSDFSYAAELFEGLTVLRPQLINELLINCKSIRTKRLFLFFSDYYQHQWVNKIEKNKVLLGSGKIQIIKGGRMDRRYFITVPAEFYNVQ